MSEPSTCVGCIYAEWDRTTNGRLHRSGDGSCGYFSKNRMDYRLPAAFHWHILSPPVPCGGLINRRAKDCDINWCHFKEEAKP